MKAQLNQQLTCFTKFYKSNVATFTASYELSQITAASGKPYTDSAFIKNFLVKTAKTLCPDKVQLFKDVELTRNTVADRIDEMFANLKNQIRAASTKFKHFFLAIVKRVIYKTLKNLQCLFELEMLSYKYRKNC